MELHFQVIHLMEDPLPPDSRRNLGAAHPVEVFLALGVSGEYEIGRNWKTIFSHMGLSENGVYPQL